MTGLSSTLRLQEVVGSDRQIFDLGAGWTPTDNLRLFADFRHQKRDGVDITAGSGFTQSSLLPRWIDFETDQIDIGIQYGMRNGSLKLAYYGSFFSNQSNSCLTWDTPYTAAAGAEAVQAGAGTG